MTGNAGNLALSGNYATLQGVTVDIPLLLNDGGSGPLIFNGGVTLNGPMLIDGRDARFAVTQTLDGTGTITIDHTSTGVPWYGIKQEAGATLTIGPGITVTTKPGGGGVIGILNSAEGDDHVSLINRGTIAVTPGTDVTIGGRNWKNLGLITIGEGGSLTLGGTFDYADLGNVVRNGQVVNFAARRDITGQIFNLNESPVGPLDLGSANFTGGCLVAPGRRVSVREAGLGGQLMLTGTTLALDLDVLDMVQITYQRSDIVLDGATIRLRGENSRVETYGINYGITGSGEIVFDADSTMWWSPTVSVGSIGPGVVLRTGTSGGTISGGNAIHRPVLEGHVISSTPGLTLHCDDPVDNRGLMHATSGGHILFRGTNAVGARLIADAGGALHVGAGAEEECFNEGEIRIDRSAAFTVEGTLGGAGTVHVDGTLSAGHYAYLLSEPIASATLDCPVELSATSVLEFDIAGREPWQYDRLTFNRPLVMRGALKVDLADSFRPMPGDSCVVATFASVTGVAGPVLSGTASGVFVITPVLSGNALSLVFEVRNRGDADRDGYVGTADLAALAAHWNAPADWAGGDFDGDGAAGIEDLQLLAANWMSSPEWYYRLVEHFGLPAVPIPEPGPAAASLPLLAMCAAVTRQRRRSLATSCPSSA